MTLPTIGTPTYETILPSTKEKIKYRPFLVKEEKILLLAMESRDKKAQYRALKQILRNCILSSVNVERLCAFDVEYLFVQIRGKSVGEILEPIVVCPNCQTQGKLKINISDVEVNDKNKVETPYKIMLSDKIGITLVYPTMEMMEDIDPDKAIGTADAETVFKIIARCIDSIFDGEKLFSPKDHSEKELIGFLENCPSEAFRKILEFLSSMPRVEKEVKFRCPNCGIEKDMVLKGIEDFFGSVSPTTA
jgi:hypothetical protein